MIGDIHGDMLIPGAAVTHRDLTIKGKWMYERENGKELINMVEVGVLRLGGKSVRKFGLEDCERALRPRRGCPAELCGYDCALRLCLSMSMHCVFGVH